MRDLVISYCFTKDTFHLHTEFLKTIQTKKDKNKNPGTEDKGIDARSLEFCDNSKSRETNEKLLKNGAWPINRVRPAHPSPMYCTDRAFQ